MHLQYLITAIHYILLSLLLTFEQQMNIKAERDQTSTVCPESLCYIPRRRHREKAVVLQLFLANNWIIRCQKLCCVLEKKVKAWCYAAWGGDHNFPFLREAGDNTNSSQTRKKVLVTRRGSVELATIPKMERLSETSSRARTCPKRMQERKQKGTTLRDLQIFPSCALPHLYNIFRVHSKGI